jgi:PKD repeat protein
MKIMRKGKARVLLVAAVAMVALVAFALPAPAAADVPCRFWGPVQFNGENVPDGTVITAWLEGPVGPWSSTTYLYQGTTVYSIDVPPSFPGPGAHEGDTVYFSVTRPGESPLPAPSSIWTQYDGAYVWHPLYLTGPQPPVADFSGTPQTGCAPLEVHFTDLSAHEPTSWDWDFGDGSPHSIVQNPIHTYTEPSTGNTAVSYNVSLTATNTLGSDTETKAGYITVHPPLNADFTATPLSGQPPLSVSFTDLSTGTITGWDWNFGDGSPHSNLQNPSHIYAEGVYNVTLTITGQGGSDTAIEQNYIVVGVGILGGHVDLQGRPSAPDDSWITDLTVTFIQDTTVVRTETVTTDNVGNFTIPDVDPGTYDIGVKSPTALSNLETGVLMVSGAATPVDFGTLLEGDCDNNDVINIYDFGILADAFGSVPASGNWDERADLNNDGAVNIYDFGLLADNFGLSGEMV